MTAIYKLITSTSSLASISDVFARQIYEIILKPPNIIEKNYNLQSTTGQEQAKIDNYNT